MAALEASLSDDQLSLRSAAELLTEVGRANFSWLVQALAFLLSAEDLAGPLRQQAGLQLKLLISRNKPSFCQLEPASKLSLRSCLLASLGTETWRPSTAGLCIQAGLEEDWEDLLPCLVRNILDNSPAMIASIESLKCICSGGDEGLVERHVDQVLTGIMYGVTQDREETVVAALQALLECLDWTAGNFARQQERNYIMTVVCNLTQSGRQEVSSLALECLSRIVTLFYPLMEEYMMVALVPISLQALQSGQERTVLQAIEFWANICDCELGLADNSLRDLLGDCSETLVDLLHRLMVEADTAHLDMEEWSQFSAAANCLSLLCQCLGPRVSDHSLAFTSRMIQSGEWRNKHAAIINLSTILEMEDRLALASIVSSFLSLADSLLQAENTHIRAAASYTLLQVSDRAEDALKSSQSQAAMLGLASACLQSEETRIAEQGCLVISNILLRALGEQSSHGLSECLGTIGHHLLSLTDIDSPTVRVGSAVRQLAFTALSDLIDQEAQHSDWLHTALPRIMRRLDLLVSSEPSSGQNSDISFNSSILNSIILRLERAEVLTLAAEILQVISRMFDHQQLHVDALLLLRALVDQLGELIFL